MSQMHVFVSHSQQDARWCRAFVRDLRQAGADVWYDEDRLHQGQLANEIERHLRARPVFIVVYSPAAVASTFVGLEVFAAIQFQSRQPDRILLPVIAEKCTVPPLLWAFRRISGLNDEGLLPADAAQRVIHALALDTTPALTPLPDAPAAFTGTPDDVWELGKALRAQGRTQEALRAFEWAVGHEPRETRYWTSVGAVFNELKRYGEALEAFDRALALTNLLALAWEGKGYALVGLKQYAEALAAFEQSLSLAQDVASAWTGKGIALSRLNRDEDALGAFEQAIQLTLPRRKRRGFSGYVCPNGLR